jgi:hypothetical protein
MPDFPRVTSHVLTTFLLGATTAALAQQPGPNPFVRHLIGLENIKSNATGKLSVQNSALEFKDKKADAQVPVSDIDDIFTGSEIGQSGGRTGQLAKVAAPYGSGRVLSLLLRNKVDILTVSYHSADGGLHGAIFALPKGQASRVREELIHAGAHASPALAPEVQEGRKP